MMAYQMLERELERAVFALLDARPALLWHHCSAAYRCHGTKGFPDLVITGSRTIFRELKGSETRMRLYQSSYGRQLSRSGCSWATWRPEDLESGLIEKELDNLL